MSFTFLLVSIVFSLVHPSVRGQNCTQLVTIYARGTNEPGVGISIGPALIRDLNTTLPNLSKTFLGVDYPADVTGALIGGSIQGSQTMAQMVATTAGNCTDTEIVMVGYSQGAQVVHRAVSLLSSGQAASVAAVVMFGDPKNGTSLANGLDSRSRTFCHEDDLVCKNKPNITDSHKTYHTDGSTLVAAEFIAVNLFLRAFEKTVDIIKAGG
ncbi:cutinase [Flagelloscypha sp. PMI_526]|nr:cutinase [Flagelloscypha sp. PMI_526]